jgi:hypothetical protein
MTTSRPSRSRQSGSRRWEDMAIATRLTTGPGARRRARAHQLYPDPWQAHGAKPGSRAYRPIRHGHKSRRPVEARTPTAARRAIIKNTLRCVAVTVTQFGGQSAKRMFMHGPAPGEHPHLPRGANLSSSSATFARWQSDGSGRGWFAGPGLAGGTARPPSSARPATPVRQGRPERTPLR